MAHSKVVSVVASMASYKVEGGCVPSREDFAGAQRYAAAANRQVSAEGQVTGPARYAARKLQDVFVSPYR